MSYQAEGYKARALEARFKRHLSIANMISVRRLLAFSVTSLSTVAAQWLDDRPLGSCADLGCPQRDNVTIVPACRVDNQTYDGIGVDTFPFNASDPDSQNLTWTMAYHDYTNYDPDKNLERTIEKAFFLGTPDGLNLTDASAYGGCAVILEAYDTRFPGDGGLKGFKCEDTIGSDCYKELQDDVLSFAKNQSRQTNSTGDMCGGLEDYIKSISSSSSSDSKCSMTWTQKHYLRKSARCTIAPHAAAFKQLTIHHSAHWPIRTRHPHRGAEFNLKLLSY